MRRSSRSAIAVLAVSTLLPIVAACSGDDDAAGTATDAGADADRVDAPDATSAVSGGSATSAPSGASGASGATGATGATGPSDPSDQVGPSDPDASVAPEPTPPIVPETGVPGLASDDAFCAAWSRFAGTWQVLLVGSTFLGDPAEVARWEVIASQVLLDAWRTLDTELPAELEPERDDAVDGYFGSLGRRAQSARDALAAAGATDDDVAQLTAAWLAALAERDPTSPDVEPAVPAGLVAVVDAAAAELRAQRIDFHLDPSLAVTVETPLTDAYLEEECPDQGTLAGGEVAATAPPDQSQVSQP